MATFGKLKVKWIILAEIWLQPAEIYNFSVNQEHSVLNCCLSHPSWSIYCLDSSLAVCPFPGIGYVPQPTSWETPLVPASWNTCPVMSCRGRTPSSATRWWRRRTRSRTSSSARRTSTRTRGARKARLRCRGCG